MQTEPRNRKKLAPKRLPEKLLSIRQYLGMTQAKMLRAINPIEKSERNRARVSQYEKGSRNPSLVETNNYADLAQIDVGILINDDIDLPVNIKKQRRQIASKIKRSVGSKVNDGLENKVPSKENRNSKTNAESIDEKEVCNRDSFRAKNDDNETVTLTENNLPVDADKMIHPSADFFAAHQIHADTCLMPVSIEMLRQCLKMYHEIIDRMPFDKISCLSFNALLENIIMVSINDHKNRGAESAIECRIRQLIEGE